MHTMKTKKQGLHRFAALCAAVLLCLSLALPAAAVSQSEINSLRDKAGDLSDQKDELKGKIDALSDDKDEALEKKELLDQQCTIIQQEIDNVNAQIKEYDALIAQKEVELAETQAKEETQYQLFCERVRVMEENGTVSYWEVIFKASSFSDLLSRIDFVNEIMDYDEKVIQQLKDLQAQIETEKADLETARSEQQAAKASLADKKAELQQQLDAASALITKINTQTAEYQDTLDALAAEENAIQVQIVAKSRQLAEQQAAAAAAGNSSSGQSASTAVSSTTWTGSGGYIWPETSSKRISSPYGTRMHPIYHRYITHNGVDISGVGTSTQVLAAKAGTVIVSKYSSSYGNYIVISHGSGNTTLYAHMSQRLVSTGQSVSQGQVIGITGSTGNSTGPHLHFEVTEGGSRVNPLQYLSGYIQAW